jgi:hypothetical protein
MRLEEAWRALLLEAWRAQRSIDDRVPSWPRTGHPSAVNVRRLASEALRHPQVLELFVAPPEATLASWFMTHRRNERRAA